MRACCVTEIASALDRPSPSSRRALQHRDHVLDHGRDRRGLVGRPAARRGLPQDLVEARRPVARAVARELAHAQVRVGRDGGVERPARRLGRRRVVGPVEEQVEAAGDHERLLRREAALGEHRPDRAPHVPLAGQRPVALHAHARGRGPHAPAEERHVAPERLDVLVALAGLEQRVPGLVPGAVAPGRRQRLVEAALEHEVLPAGRQAVVVGGAAALGHVHAPGRRALGLGLVVLVVVEARPEAGVGRGGGAARGWRLRGRAPLAVGRRRRAPLDQLVAALVDQRVVRQVDEPHLGPDLARGLHDHVLGRVGQERVPGREAGRDVGRRAHDAREAEHVLVVAVHGVDRDGRLRLRVDDVLDQVVGLGRPLDQDDLRPAGADRVADEAGGGGRVVPHGEPVERVAQERVDAVVEGDLVEELVRRVGAARGGRVEDGGLLPPGHARAPSWRGPWWRRRGTPSSWRPWRASWPRPPGTPRARSRRPGPP